MDGTEPDADPVFHVGEQAAQRRAGVQERIAEIGPRIMRDFMPDQHRELFAQLPMIFVGSLDARQRPWASILVGRPGFIDSPDARTLSIHARPLPGDPLTDHIAIGAPLALLGIELETRRRNRANGIVAGADVDGLTMRVRQSFGNCPKYIQARTPSWSEPAARATVNREGRQLSATARALIRKADTFFIATATANAASSDSRADGVDLSHRGGRPGFVRVDDAVDHTTLTFPDYIGNFMFNTLGNLLVNPRAGLLFVDFDGGALLGVTGTVDVIWDGPEVESFTNAERVLRFHVDEGWHTAAVLPFRWSPPDFSPHL